MYGSHDIRHIGFPRVDGLSTDPRDLGLHKGYDFGREPTLVCYSPFLELCLIK